MKSIKIASSYVEIDTSVTSALYLKLKDYTVSKIVETKYPVVDDQNKNNNNEHTNRKKQNVETEEEESGYQTQTLREDEEDGSSYGTPNRDFIITRSDGDFSEEFVVSNQNKQVIGENFRTIGIPDLFEAFADAKQAYNDFLKAEPVDYAQSAEDVNKQLKQRGAVFLKFIISGVTFHKGYKTLAGAMVVCYPLVLMYKNEGLIPSDEVLMTVLPAMDPLRIIEIISKECYNVENSEIAPAIVSELMNSDTFAMFALALKDKIYAQI